MQELVDRMYDMITELDWKAAEWPPAAGDRKILDQHLDKMVTACLILLGRFRASLHRDSHLSFALALFDVLARITYMVEVERNDSGQPSAGRTSPIQELVDRISDAVADFYTSADCWPPPTGDREVLDHELAEMGTCCSMLLSHFRAGLHPKRHLSFAISLVEVLTRIAQMLEIVRIGSPNSPKTEPLSSVSKPSPNARPA
jgi:hypothetical protein